MFIIVILISIWIFIKTFSYGLFELKKNKNKFGGIVVIFNAFFSAIFPNLVMYLYA